MHPEAADNDKPGQSLPISSTIKRRPWPSRNISEAEEMVKHMSSIPRYLQHEENKHNIQAKALSVGVLDWGRVQKWTDPEKPFANKTFHDSTSSTNPSSLSSAFDSSPHSSIGNTSPSTERKQFSTSDNRRHSKSSSSSDSRSSAEKGLSKGRRNLPPAPAGSDNFAKLDGLEKLEISSEQESCSSHPCKDGDRLKPSRRKHLEEIIARSMSNFDGSSAPFSDTHRDEPHEPEKNAYFSDRGRERPPIYLPRVDLKGIGVSPLKSIADNPHEAVSRSSSRGRRSPMRQLFDQPRKSYSSVGSVSDNSDAAGGRNSSRGKRSLVKQMSDSVLDSSMPDMSASRSNSRGRRSPLRQLFESPRKSSSSINSSQPLDPPTCNENSSSDPKNPPSTRRALLKLSLKNGLPLLMFSSSDDNIFVAMMHKGGSSDMNICDCFYEIHTAIAVEVKRKAGAWLSQGAKSKKPEFTSKFVAELTVSSSEQVSFDHTRCSFIRELVLLGDELAPANQADATNVSSSELGAIVVETPQQKSPSNCGIHCIPKIVAILPSDVHGLSNTREPSKLIERWRSGGSCDCGGWDEGCALTVLTNNLREIKNSKSVEGCGAIDGASCGFDLFAEGDARRGKHSFRMAAFKEDLFTVEFRASIHLLQAFAICIAMLHDRNPGDGDGDGVVMENLSSVDMYNSYEDLSFDGCPSISC